MPSEAESVVATWFHLSRKLAKHKPTGEPPAWMQERADEEYARLFEAAKADWMAELSAHERGLGLGDL